MTVRICFLILIWADLAYDLTMRALQAKRKKLPLPENVADIYEPDAYASWREYSAEKSKLGAVEKIFDALVLTALFASPAFSLLYSRLPGGEVSKSLLLLVLFTAHTSVLTRPFDWIRVMWIEAKYGFSKSSAKTFLGDELKDFILNAVLNAALFLFTYYMYRAFGSRFFWFVYAGAALFVLVFSMLATSFQRLYNKFTVLEDGELRNTLTGLFKTSGYELENIYVMDASRRTTKVNAFCSGLGRFKKIVLYDNLVNRYTPREITAVFSHELGHYKRRDTLKNTVYTLFLMGVVTAVIAWFAATPALSTAYGFEEMSIVFGVIALQAVFLPPLFTLLMIPRAAMARRFEYKADAEAAKLGYGEELISALKKLSRDNFSDLNPHPAVVLIEYDHPTVGQRIDAIRKREAEHDL